MLNLFFYTIFTMMCHKIMGLKPFSNVELDSLAQSLLDHC